MTPISSAKGALELLKNRGDKLSEEQRLGLFDALERSIANIERLARTLGSDAGSES